VSDRRRTSVGLLSGTCMAPAPGAGNHAATQKCAGSKWKLKTELSTTVFSAKFLSGWIEPNISTPRFLAAMMSSGPANVSPHGAVGRFGGPAGYSCAQPQDLHLPPNMGSHFGPLRSVLSTGVGQDAKMKPQVFSSFASVAEANNFRPGFSSAFLRWRSALQFRLQTGRDPAVGPAPVGWLA